jgi:hypothetical protein
MFFFFSFLRKNLPKEGLLILVVLNCQLGKTHINVGLVGNKEDVIKEKEGSTNWEKGIL